jgi:dipeptidyl aminopeptidase/acylaminoacyl peptidase
LKRLRRKEAPESLPSMLVLHGKEDRRVPPSQTTAFRQACAGYGVQGMVEMAIYPREGHLVRERVQSFCSCLLS